MTKPTIVSSNVIAKYKAKTYDFGTIRLSLELEMKLKSVEPCAKCFYSIFLSFLSLV